MKREIDVAVAHAAVAKEMRGRLQAELEQSRLAQKAWEQERRVITRDRDRYHQEWNSARVQVAEREENMREAGFWMAAYYHVVPDLAQQTFCYTQQTPQRPASSQSLGTWTRGYSDSPRVSPGRGLDLTLHKDQMWGVHLVDDRILCFLQVQGRWIV